MNWILEIFSDKSDQARLLAILISAVVAILVVLLNQWFLSRRSRRELLIEKIEELYLASNEYVSACRELMDASIQQSLEQLDKHYEYTRASINKLNDSITKMQMICGLYFREVKFSPEEFYIWRMPILEIAHKGKYIPEGEAHLAYEDSKAHITKSREQLDDMCKSLMKKHGH